MSDPWGSECRVSPILPVEDVDTAAAYYRDKLGFAIRPMDPDSPNFWVVAERGTVEVHLVRKDCPAGFAIRVTDVDLLSAELHRRGAIFESGPTNSPITPSREFSVFDANGTYIVFWQPISLSADEIGGPSVTEF